MWSSVERCNADCISNYSSAIMSCDLHQTDVMTLCTVQQTFTDSAYNYSDDMCFNMRPYSQSKWDKTWLNLSVKQVKSWAALFAYILYPCTHCKYGDYHFFTTGSLFVPLDIHLRRKGKGKLISAQVSPVVCYVMSVCNNMKMLQQKRKYSIMTVRIMIKWENSIIHK